MQHAEKRWQAGEVESGSDAGRQVHTYIPAAPPRGGPAPHPSQSHRSAMLTPAALQLLFDLPGADPHNGVSLSPCTARMASSSPGKGLTPVHFHSGSGLCLSFCLLTELKRRMERKKKRPELACGLDHGRGAASTHSPVWP